MATVVVTGVTPTGYSPHIVGSFLAGQQVAGFYPGVPAFGTVTIRAVYRFGPTSLPSAQAFGTVTPVGPSASLVSVAGVGSAKQFGVPTPKTAIRVLVAGIPSAQSFGTSKSGQGVHVPGLDHGRLFFHIVGSYLAGQELVGWHGDYLFGRPVFWLRYIIPGVPSAPQFGTPVFGMQYKIGGVPSAQAFGTPFIVYDQWQFVLGLGSGQQFGVTIAYKVWLHPSDCDEVDLAPSDCTELVLDPALEQDLLLVPALDG